MVKARPEVTHTCVEVAIVIPLVDIDCCRPGHGIQKRNEIRPVQPVWVLATTSGRWVLHGATCMSEAVIACRRETVRQDQLLFMAR